jgi:hypothetical protein
MRTPWIAVLLVLLMSGPAFAQRMDQRGVPYRVWDMSAAPDILWLSYSEASDTTLDTSHWDARWVATVTAGRYWNSHVKAEVGVLAGARSHWGADEAVALPGGALVYAWRWGETRQTQVSFALSYQAFENAFFHPYVLAGGRLAFRSTHVSRDPDVRRYVNGVYELVTLPPVGQSTSDVRFRPFVGAGSKTYFSERVFLRPELTLVFNERGLCQSGLRLGLGVDF